MSHVDSLFSLPLKILLVFAILQVFILGYNWAYIEYVTASLADDVAKNGEMQDAAVTRVANHLNRWTIGYPGGVSRSSSYAVSDSAAIIWGPESGTKIQRGDPVTVGISFPIKTQIYVIDNIMSGWGFSKDTLYVRASFTALSDAYYE